MTTELAAPVPVLTVGAADLARIDDLLARKRAELGRLRLRLRSAVRRAEHAEAEATRIERSVAPVDAPAPLLATVDALLTKATHRADLALTAARRQAAARIALAHQRSSAERSRLGLTALSPVDPVDWMTNLVPDLTRPPTARALWTTVEAATRGTGPAVLVARARAAAAAPEPVVVEPAEPVGAGEGLRPVAALDDDLVLLAERPEPAPLGTLVPVGAHPPVASGRTAPSPTARRRRPGSGPMPRVPDEAVLFDVFWRGEGLEGVFWSEAEAGWRPIRDRLRRRDEQGFP